METNDVTLEEVVNCWDELSPLLKQAIEESGLNEPKRRQVWNLVRRRFTEEKNKAFLIEKYKEHLS